MANQVSSLAATFLVDPGGLAGDELEVVARRDVNHGGPDALDAGIAFVALPGGAEEEAALPMHPDKMCGSRCRRRSS